MARRCLNAASRAVNLNHNARAAWLSGACQAGPGAAGIRRSELLRAAPWLYSSRYSDGEQTIEAQVADDESATLLGIRLGDPVLVIRRVTSTRRNRVLEYAISTYRGDRYRVGMHLDRQRMSSLVGTIDDDEQAEKGAS